VTVVGVILLVGARIRPRNALVTGSGRIRE
jgi:hypothetical protein